MKFSLTREKNASLTEMHFRTSFPTGTKLHSLSETSRSQALVFWELTYEGITPCIRQEVAEEALGKSGGSVFGLYLVVKGWICLCRPSAGRQMLAFRLMFYIFQTLFENTPQGPVCLNPHKHSSRHTMGQ